MRTSTSCAVVLTALLATATTAAQTRPDWRTDHDFDGDGRPDRVDVAFTGGAHCCYVLTVHLTASSRTVRVPFEIEGGYVRGLDLGRPDDFNVADYDGDGAEELCLREPIIDATDRGNTVRVRFDRAGRTQRAAGACRAPSG